MYWLQSLTLTFIFVLLFPALSGMTHIVAEESREKEPGILDFTDLVFESHKINYSNIHCPPPPELRPLLCRPDPTKDICASIPEHVKKRADELEALSLKKDQDFKRFLDQSFDLIKKKIYSRDDQKRQKYEEEMNNLRNRFFSENLMEGRESDVKRNVENARRIFINFVSKSHLLSPGQIKIISKILETCTKSTRYDAFLGIKSRNASNRRNTGIDQVFQELNDVDMKPDEVKAVLHPLQHIGCTWHDCAEGTDICFETLFHEFAHSMNSCTFQEFADAREIESENIRELEDKSLYNMMADLLHQAESQSSGRGRNVAEALEDSVGCLAELSQPRNAIPNACKGEVTRYRAHTREKCGVGAVRGFPSEWDEAEADFWAASAMGEYFKEQFSKPIDRQSKFQDIIATWCYETAAYKTNMKSSDEEAKKKIEDMIKNVAKGDKKTEKEMRDLFKKLGILDEPEPCELQAAKGYSIKGLKPWVDSHQTMQVRFNRNFLRNLDLRDSLGCEGLYNDLPSACSPRGVRKIILPQ